MNLSPDMAMHFTVNANRSDMENLSDRGDLQLIYLGITNPYAKIFPASCKPPVPAEADKAHLTTTTWLEALVNILPALSCPAGGSVTARLGNFAPGPDCLESKLRLILWSLED